jgi:hypothetical protein
MATTTPRFVIYQGTGEWSALYVDGKLDTVGDHYRIYEERLPQLVGAEVRYSDAFLQGGDKATDCVERLADVPDETEKAGA